MKRIACILENFSLWKHPIGFGDKRPFDNLTICYVLLPKMLWHVKNRFYEESGEWQRGLIVRRDGVFLSGVIWHKLSDFNFAGQMA